jgi:hypothetical protein
MKTTNEEADSLPQTRSQGILASYKALQEIQKALGENCELVFEVDIPQED